MDVRTFTVFNLLGGLIWSVGVTLLGYALGKSISDVDRYLLPIIAVIVAASFAPVGIEFLRNRRARSGRKGHRQALIEAETAD